VVGIVAPTVIRDGTIYYIDALGTLFARDAKTGGITDPTRHWTTTLVDPDYAAQTPAVAPDLYYSAPVVSGAFIWIHSSLNGRVHAIRKAGGAELDFDPAAPVIQPLALVLDQTLASNLGEPVVVQTYIDPSKADTALDGADSMTDRISLKESRTGSGWCLSTGDSSWPSYEWNYATPVSHPQSSLCTSSARRGHSAIEGFRVSERAIG